MLLYTCVLTQSPTTLFMPRAERRAVWLLTDSCSNRMPFPDSRLAQGPPWGWGLWASPWALMWPGHRRHPYTIPSSVRVTCCRRERRQGETSSRWWESTGPPQAAWGSSWPLLTLWYKTDRPGGEVLRSKWGFSCGDVGVWEWCRRGSGDFSFFLSRDRLPVPVTAHQAQFLCAGGTSTCQPDVILGLSGLSFRLCAATYTHISS